MLLRPGPMLESLPPSSNDRLHTRQAFALVAKVTQMFLINILGMTHLSAAQTALEVCCLGLLVFLSFGVTNLGSQYCGGDLSAGL